MKKCFVLIAFIVSLSCSNNNTSLNDKSFEKPTIYIKEHSTSTLVKEKFLEFFDLKVLLKNKPMFNKSIKKRLANFKLDSTTLLGINNDSEIKNLKATELILDKKTKNTIVKLVFEIHSKEKYKKDSVLAYIFKDDIAIDGNKTTLTKVKFSKFTK